MAWSATQLLGPILPIRSDVSASTRLALVPSLAAALVLIPSDDALGAGWNAVAARVLVQNRSGEFEPLVADAATVVAATPPAGDDAGSVLRFRVEPYQSIAAAPLAVPVEYRITVGQGDEIAVWSFPSVLRLGGPR